MSQQIHKEEQFMLDELSRITEVKQVVDWHAKYTPWMNEIVVKNYYIPLYVLQGMSLKEYSKEDMQGFDESQQWEYLQSIKPSILAKTYDDLYRNAFIEQSSDNMEIEHAQ